MSLSQQQIDRLEALRTRIKDGPSRGGAVMMTTSGDGVKQYAIMSTDIIELISILLEETT